MDEDEALSELNPLKKANNAQSSQQEKVEKAEIAEESAAKAYNIVPNSAITANNFLKSEVSSKILTRNKGAGQVYAEEQIEKQDIFRKKPAGALVINNNLETQELTSQKKHVLTDKKRVKKTSENVPHFIGHRARLKEKCYKFAANLSDYEILEIMLFWAIPRKDTKTLAKLLLSTFGSLSEILYAEEDKLLAVPQITKNIRLNFTIIKEFLERILKSRFINKHVLSSWSALIEYLQTTMGDIKTEQFRVIFLNKKNMVIADEVQASGTVDQTPVYPREIVKRALFHEASAIILVHNHPSGNPKPSKADIAITQEIKQACESLSILLHDHVIVCKNKFLSFKSEYLL